MATQQIPLYTSWSGYPIVDFSYSMAKEIAECGRKVSISRIDGWQGKERRSYLSFGQGIEAAIAGWIKSSGHENIADLFSAWWLTQKNVPIIYKKQEKDWAYMDTMGRRAVTRFQYAYENGDLPIMEGAQFSKRLWLNNWYNGTNLQYIADALTPGGTVVDFKTSEKSKPENFGKYIPLDRQLRIGSLVSQCRNVGLLTIAWGNTGEVKWYPATITEELVDDVNLWLKAQWRKYVDREFFRNPGVGFPDQHCNNCDFFKACLHGDYSDLVRRDMDSAKAQLDELGEEE